MPKKRKPSLDQSFQSLYDDECRNEPSKYNYDEPSFGEHLEALERRYESLIEHLVGDEQSIPDVPGTIFYRGKDHRLLEPAGGFTKRDEIAIIAFRRLQILRKTIAEGDALRAAEATAGFFKYHYEINVYDTMGCWTFEAAFRDFKRRVDGQQKRREGRSKKAAVENLLKRQQAAKALASVQRERPDSKKTTQHIAAAKSLGIPLSTFYKRLNKPRKNLL